MSLILRVCSIVAACALSGTLALPSVALAQGSSRAGTWEFILPITYSPSSSSFDGENGSSAKLHSDVGWGLGLAYNFNDHFQLGGSITWSSRGYDATLRNTDGTTRNGSGTLDSSTIGLNATYFFRPSGFMPFVTGAIGSTFLDTNIQNGLPVTQCWWDPWYGYICSSYTPTKTDTAFSYSAGVGARFEVTRTFSVQGSYNRMWIDYGKGTPEIDGLKLEFVFRL